MPGLRMTTHGQLAVLPAFVLALASVGPAHAQPTTFRSQCTTYGPNAIEPVGDREGHGIQVSEAACVSEEGPVAGAVTTQNSLWEFDKLVGRMLSSHGFTRKPGVYLAYVNLTGALTLQVADGQVTGWTAEGKGAFPVATGSAAWLAGKTYSWTARPTGPRTFIVDTVLD